MITALEARDPDRLEAILISISKLNEQRFLAHSNSQVSLAYQVDLNLSF